MEKIKIWKQKIPYFPNLERLSWESQWDYLTSARSALTLTTATFLGSLLRQKRQESCVTSTNKSNILIKLSNPCSHFNKWNSAIKKPNKKKAFRESAMQINYSAGIEVFTHWIIPTKFAPKRAWRRSNFQNIYVTIN